MTQLVHIKIGDGAWAKAPALLRTTLGSCVGVGLFWPAERIFGLAHTVLPTLVGVPTHSLAFRYVDGAIGTLLAKLQVPANEFAQVKAVLCGGSHIWTGKGEAPMEVGARNVQMARRELRKRRIRVVAEDVLGTDARQMSIDCATGIVSCVSLRQGIKVQTLEACLLRATLSAELGGLV